MHVSELDSAQLLRLSKWLGAQGLTLVDELMKTAGTLTVEQERATRGLSEHDEFTRYIQGQVDAVGRTDIFCQLYSPNMADFVSDPAPAIQLAIAILQDKPIIIACPTGRVVPPKLLAIADAVVYGDEAELAKGIRAAAQHWQQEHST